MPHRMTGGMYAHGVRRSSVLAFVAATGLGVVVACSTFESGDGSTPGPDASDETVPPIDAPIVEAATDAGDETGPVCEPEPVWVTPSSPVPTATCNGVGGI